MSDYNSELRSDKDPEGYQNPNTAGGGGSGGSGREDTVAYNDDENTEEYGYDDSNKKSNQEMKNRSNSYDAKKKKPKPQMQTAPQQQYSNNAYVPQPPRVSYHTSRSTAPNNNYKNNKNNGSKRNYSENSSPSQNRQPQYQQYRTQAHDEQETDNEVDNNDNEEDEDEDDDDQDDRNDESYPLSAQYQSNPQQTGYLRSNIQQQQQQAQYQQKQTLNKILKTDTHISKSNTMNSSNSMNNINQNQNRTNQAVPSANHYQLALKNHHTNSVPKPAANHLNLAGHSFGYEIDPKDDKIDLWGHLLIGISYFFLIFSFPFSLCACVKVAQEYERAVIFRLGRILPGGAKGPGIFFVLPCIDTYTKVDLRTVTFDVPPQEILTKDSVTVSVDAVVYFRIFNAVISVINVEDAAKSTKLLAASTLRNILGTKSLHEILSDRESVAILIQNNLDEATGPWYNYRGVKVERVEVKDVRLPVQLQRAMATEAEAAREARAKVIAAEGEQKASKALKEAAEVISESPIAIQLRYLQTLTQIASEKNSTIVFPIPLEMLSFLANKSINMFKPKT